MMTTVQDFDRLVEVLTTRAGWIQLGLLLLCLGVAWILDHRIRLKTEGRQGAVRIGLGSVNRVIFPLTALGLLFVVRLIYHSRRAAIVLDLGVSLLSALAIIRVTVYLLRSQFVEKPWLRVSEQVISYGVWLTLVCYLTGLLPEIVDQLRDITFLVGKHELNLWQILSGTLLILSTMMVTLWLAGIVERRLIAWEALDSGLRVMVAKLLKSFLLLAAILFALSAVGIDLTVLSVFGGALGVGLGIGLQKIASNYVSGYLILADRSIRPGDLITVDGRYGLVSRLTARYVVVRSLDGVEAIVPNDTLITTTVINHSYSNHEVRLVIPVTISYDNDPQLAMRLLEEVARKQARVLQLGDYAPHAYLMRFGDNGIELELGIWIRDPEEGQSNLRSEINQQIWAIFQAHQIKIPFPQHEVRVLGGLGPN